MKGWSEYQLAEHSGITQSTISSWYRKDVTPSVKSLHTICDTLGITLSQLFSETEDDEFLQLTEMQKLLLRESIKLTEEQQAALVEFVRTL